MADGNVERRLLEAAGQYADRYSVRLACDAILVLQSEIEKAEAEGQLRDEDEVRRAESAVGRWILQATQVTEERMEALPIELHDDDLLRALGGLCPGFWPFC
jgi:hypothetical protein